MDELGDIVSEFLVESHENLDQLDRDLVALEQAPGSRELLSSIFRTIHTIKGTSGFLAFAVALPFVLGEVAWAFGFWSRQSSCSHCSPFRLPPGRPLTRSRLPFAATIRADGCWRLRSASS